MIRLAPITVSLFLLLVTGTVTAAESAPVTRYALVIGQNVGSARTTPLRFAEQDARKIATLLQQLSNVPTENLTLLIAPDVKTLRQSLSEMRARLALADGQRFELFVYFSGHADNQGLQLKDTSFPLAELRAFLKDSGASVTIAIIDACHSGAIIRDKGGKRVPILDITGGGSGDARGVAVITSSSATEKSQESDELRGSFFTHFLASGMRGDADSSRDNLVTLYELYQYAYKKTRQRTYTTGRTEQHPTFDYAVTGSGELVVSFLEKGQSRLILPKDWAGNYLLYSPASDQVLAEIEKVAGEVRILVVPPGTIEIFKRTDETLQKASVSIGEGEEKVAPDVKMVEVSRTYLIEKGEGTVITLGAKGGYQLFWNQQVRNRALLPSVIGGIELRIPSLLGRGISPFAEVLIGGSANTSKGASSALAQTFSCVEAGLGVSFTLLSSPLLIEVSPQVSMYYAYLSVRNPDMVNETDQNHYAMVSPSASLLVGKEFGRAFSLALQVKTGYLYFRDSVSDYGKRAQHLGFSEMFLTAKLKL
jgi:hypothetical protein